MIPELDFSKLHPIMHKMINSGFSRELLALGQIVTQRRLEAARDTGKPDKRFRLSWLLGEAALENTSKSPTLFDDDCRCAALLMLKYHGNRMGLTDAQIADIQTCLAADHANSAFYRALQDQSLPSLIDPAQYTLIPAYHPTPSPLQIA